jgi:hypothetical protein
MERLPESTPPHRTPRDLAEAIAAILEAQNAPSPAAVRLASALAERLDAVVPVPFHVRAEGGLVASLIGAHYDTISDVAGVLERDAEDSPFVERVLTVCHQVLNNVQDMIAEDTTEPWPRLPNGRMANPGTRADAELIYLWYGPDTSREDGAVIILPPIALAALERD